MAVPEEVKVAADARIALLTAEKINKQAVLNTINAKIAEAQAVVDNLTTQRDAILAEIANVDASFTTIKAWRQTDGK